LGNLSDEAAVTRLANEVDIDVQPCSQADGRNCDVILDGVDVTWLIRLPEVEANVSQVSAYAGVRKALVEQQRRIGLRGRIVMVGRDIGTVVLPDADLKVYLDATVEERARRRYQEVKKRGDMSTYAEILANLRKRDQIDSTRAVSPLRPADDAVVILTDGLSIDEVVERVKALF
jgi:CMP/dCMP kinase